MPRVNDETWLGNLGRVHHTPHRLVAEEKRQMGLFRLVCPHVAQSESDAGDVVNRISEQRQSVMTRPQMKEGGVSGAYLLVPMIPGLGNDRFQRSELLVRH